MTTTHQQTAESQMNPRFALEPSVWFFAGQLEKSAPMRQVNIQSSPFTVGRRDASLTLPCNSVSKLHAELTLDAGNLFLRDLGSTNGTYLNGQRLGQELTQINEGDLVQFATVVFRVGREKSEDLTMGTIQGEEAGDSALALLQFDRLINEGAVVPFYQPIVPLENIEDKIGYEILGRSRLFGLKTPAEMFQTAAQLNMEFELSCVLRQHGINTATTLKSPGILFVNTHPVELQNYDQLENSLRNLRTEHPDLEIALEIHEAAITSPDQIQQLRQLLNELNMRLAFDDFGAGQARLLELSEVQPDFLKFDMKLIQGIHRAPASRQQVLAMLASVVNRLGIESLAEGVERQEDHETLKQMGFKLGQGFLYGRPAAAEDYQ